MLNHDSSILLLDSVLERTLADEDIEVSSDGCVSKYSDEIKRALLLTVSEDKRNDQSANNGVDQLVHRKDFGNFRSDTNQFEMVNSEYVDDHCSDMDVECLKPESLFRQKIALQLCMKLLTWTPMKVLSMKMMILKWS